MSSLLSDVRPQERRGVLAAFVALFGILTGHTLLETARDALFLARLPASQLPWVYLAMAGVAVVVSQARWGGGRSRGFLAAHGLSASLLASAAGSLVFYLLDLDQGAWRLRGLYVWTGLVGTLTALQFWLVLGELYDISQAKRLFRLVASGSLLGALFGSGAGRVIVGRAEPATLVLAAALVFAATALGPALLLRRPGQAAEPEPRRHRHPVEELRAALLLAREQPYVVRLGGLVLISTVALTLGDYVFKSVVASNVPREQLGVFFATLNLGLNGLALVVQLALMGWLLRVLGLHRALWVLPGLVLLGSAGLTLGGGLLAALLLKGADGSLRHSLHRTTTELLFLPIPDGLRARAKPVIDVLGQRGGQALASILILAETPTGRADVSLPAAAALLCLVWIAVAGDLKPLYLALFRKALRDGSMSRRSDAPDLDLGSLETLIAALNSQDDQEVIGALDVLAHEGRARLIPALVLYHPSRRVVLRAFELFAVHGRADCAPIAERLMGHLDADIRAAALRTLSSLRPDEALLRGSMQDPSPLVRATALVGLVSGGWVADETQATLDDLLAGQDPGARRALAQAIARQPAPALGPALADLVAGHDAPTRALAARALGQLRSEESLPHLLRLLADYETREAAREALSAYGERGLRFLAAAQGDPGLPRYVRRHIPRALLRFEPEQAAAVLLPRLLEESDGGIRYKALRSLGRLATDHPDLQLDRAVLREAAERTLEALGRTLHWRLELVAGAVVAPSRRTTGHELLVTLLRQKQEQGLERLFRLLGLLLRGEDFERVYRGLRNVQPKVRASSRELLENALPGWARERVLALVDDGDERRRLAVLAGGAAAGALPYEGLLSTLLGVGDETLRCLAAYHVGELGLTDLRGRLETFRQAEASPFFTRVLERALELLALPPGAGRLAHAE